MAGSATKSLLKEFKSFAAFPVQIEGGTTDGSGHSSASAGEVVDQALRQVLGARTRVNDADGVRRALDRAFGDRPGTAGSGMAAGRKTELNSELTGIQGSLFTRAEDVVTQAIPLLDSLQSLRDNLGARDAHATSVVIRQVLNDLRAELGRENGPRVSLVEQYWTVLLGYDTSDPQTADPNAIGGALGNLRDVLGLGSTPGPGGPGGGQIDSAITTEDEGPVTSFRLLTDLTVGLFIGWLGSINYFRAGRRNQPFLGDSLRRLSLAAASVQEAAARVQIAFDSVYIGEADRRALVLPLPGAPDELALQDLIEWAEQLVGPEATKLIQDGGRRAIGDYLRPNARRVARLISQASKLRIPGGYSSPRVQAALVDLAAQTRALSKEFRRVAPPPPSGDVLVPVVTGQDVAAATAAIAAAGLTITTIAAYDQQSQGEVLSTTPVSGTNVPRGSNVAVTYSTGPMPILVPDLTGQTLDAATTLLRLAGLAIGKVTAPAGLKRAAGKVVRFAPAAGNAVALGSIVDVELVP